MIMSCSGYCRRCREVHTLPTTPGAIHAVRILRQKLLSSYYYTDNTTTNPVDYLDLSNKKWWLIDEEENNTIITTDDKRNAIIDQNNSSSSSSIYPTTRNYNNKSYANSSLLAGKRGKMIGVLEVLDVDTNEVLYLAGYAGKFVANNNWIQPGWVEPLVIPQSIPDFVRSADDVFNMTQLIEHLLVQNNNNNNETNNNQTVLSELRRSRSRRATEGIRALQAAQIITNFRNESTSIPEAYYDYDNTVVTTIRNNSKMNNTIQHQQQSNQKKKRRSSRQRRRQRQQQQQLLFQQQQQLLFQQQQEEKKSLLLLTSSSPQYSFYSKTIGITRSPNSTKSLLNLNNNSKNIIPYGGMPRIEDETTITTKLLPAGIGECAAIRLLNAAAKTNGRLRPLGIAEIFVGPSKMLRQDGMLYDACKIRCQPILGWMLCGCCGS